MTTRLVRVLGGFALLAAAGCASPAEQAAPSDPTTTTTATATADMSTRPTPPTTLPAAVDGTNAAVCGTGACEIQVSATTPVPLPDTAGAMLTVDSVDGTAARLAFAPTGVDFSFACVPLDACTSRLTMVNGKQGSIVTTPVGATATFNKAAVTVVAVVGAAAVLRISPA